MTGICLSICRKYLFVDMQNGVQQFARPERKYEFTISVSVWVSYRLCRLLQKRMLYLEDNIMSSIKFRTGEQYFRTVYSIEIGWSCSLLLSFAVFPHSLIYVHVLIQTGDGSRMEF